MTSGVWGIANVSLALWHTGLTGVSTSHLNRRSHLTSALNRVGDAALTGVSATGAYRVLPPHLNRVGHRTAPAVIVVAIGSPREAALVSRSSGGVVLAALIWVARGALNRGYRTWIMWSPGSVSGRISAVSRDARIATALSRVTK